MKRKLEEITEAEALELVKLIHRNSPHEPLTDDEITIEGMVEDDGGLLMDADVAVAIQFTCRCFEGDLILFYGGGVMLQNPDSGNLTRVDNVAEVVFWLKARKFDLTPILTPKR